MLEWLEMADALLCRAIGGNLVAANLARDGALKLFSKQEIDWVESYSLKFDSIAREAAHTFIAFDDNELALNKMNRRFTKRLHYVTG